MATYSRDLLADDLHVSTFAPMAALVGITVYCTFDLILVFSVVIYKWAASPKSIET